MIALKHAGDALALGWKAKGRENCTIEIQEINIEVVVQAFDKAIKAPPLDGVDIKAREAQVVSLHLIRVLVHCRYNTCTLICFTCGASTTQYYSFCRTRKKKPWKYEMFCICLDVLNRCNTHVHKIAQSTLSCTF